jgi:hypothetical protein
MGSSSLLASLFSSGGGDRASHFLPPHRRPLEVCLLPRDYRRSFVVQPSLLPRTEVPVIRKRIFRRRKVLNREPRSSDRSIAFESEPRVIIRVYDPPLLSGSEPPPNVLVYDSRIVRCEPERGGGSSRRFRHLAATFCRLSITITNLHEPRHFGAGPHGEGEKRHHEHHSSNREP